ncbi:MAG: sugar phosphate nucleotidyltransferase [Actinomycetota bacterium]
MHAVVLVGGFGTRLRPLTNTVPKPLLPLGQRTILEWLLTHLARGGVTDAVLALGFKPEPFMQAFPDAQCAGVRLSYAIEDSPLDTAGAIGFAARTAGIHQRGETFVVANGDIVTDLAVADLVRRHKMNVQRGGQATIHLTPVDDPSQFGVVEHDADGRVAGFVEKPAPGTTTSRHVNAGTYVFEPDVLEIMPGDAPLSVERATFPELARRGTLFALPTDDYWLDAGRPDSYRRANLDLVGGRRRDREDAVHRSANVATSATVHNSVVGAAATISEGATVTDSVIFPGAVVGAGAQVSASSVMGDVAAGAVVRDALVARG